MAKTTKHIYEMDPVQLLGYLTENPDLIAKNENIQVMLKNAIDRHETTLHRARGLLNAIKENIDGH